MFTELLEEESKILEESSFIDETEKENKSNKSNFAKKNFVKRQISETPYLPISFFVDSSYPEEIKKEIFSLIDKLLAKKYTIRINGDDKEFIEKLQSLNSEHIEVYIPWKGFNDIESKYYFNYEALKNIAKANFLGWEKIPDTVKALLTRNVKMILGTSNNSVCLSVVLYTPDGATNKSELTKESGRLSFVISLASKFGIPVINLKKQKLVEMFLRNYGI